MAKGFNGHLCRMVGAKLEVNNDNKSLQISFTPEKIDEWKLLVAQLSKKPLVSRKVLMRFTGKMSWAAGFISQLKPFVRMLYAALSVKGNNADSDTVYQRQVDPAVSWISQFLHGLRGGISRTISAFKRHECQLDFYVDASPWGGGAVKLDETGRPLMTFALAWTPHDEALVGAKIGDPGSQALWEAYMMLKCVAMVGTKQTRIHPDQRRRSRCARLVSEEVSPLTSVKQSCERDGSLPRQTLCGTRSFACLERKQHLGRSAVSRHLAFRVSRAAVSGCTAALLAKLRKF